MSTPPNVSADPIVMIPLERIPTDAKSQARVKINATVVCEYTAAMTRQLAEGGLTFPPVVVFSDGRNYWLGDGFHRVLAARQAGQTEFAANVQSGSERDALLYSIAANSAHGLPRTSADKRKAVALLLADPEWSQWSDREIARHCQVGHPTVIRMRRSLSGTTYQMRRRKVLRGGTVYAMKIKSPANTRGAEETPTTTTGSAVAIDGLRIAVPPARAAVFASAADFHQAKDLFARLTDLLSRLARGPGGEVYRRDLIRTADNGYACRALRIALEQLAAAEPYCAYCPICHPRHGDWARPDCKTCSGRGWTTRTAFDACAEGDRQAIFKLRDPA